MAEYRPQGFSLLPPAVKHLIIINALCFLAQYVLAMRHIYIENVLGLWSLQSGHFRLWQPLTYMFMHGNFSHILVNMFMLWMFGNTMENYWGTRRFLFYYMVCGIGAGLLYMLVPGINLTVGASGAIYGILLAFGMTFPNEYVYLYFLMPIKTKWMIIGMVVIELMEGILVNDGVAHFAHLGGMLIGFLLILYWRKHPFSKHF